MSHRIFKNTGDHKELLWWCFLLLGSIGISFVLDMLLSSNDSGKRLNFISDIKIALQFAFWLGVGLCSYSLKATGDDQKSFCYSGLLIIMLSIILASALSIGGIMSYVAYAITFMLLVFGLLFIKG